MKILEINMPEVSVDCPECCGELFVQGCEFEVNSPKYYGVADAYCEDCDHNFTVGLI